MEIRLKIEGTVIAEIDTSDGTPRVIDVRIEQLGIVPGSKEGGQPMTDRIEFPETKQPERTGHGRILDTRNPHRGCADHQTGITLEHRNRRSDGRAHVQSLPMRRHINTGLAGRTSRLDVRSRQVVAKHIRQAGRIIDRQCQTAHPAIYINAQADQPIGGNRSDIAQPRTLIRTREHLRRLLFGRRRDQTILLAPLNFALMMYPKDVSGKTPHYPHSDQHHLSRLLFGRRTASADYLALLNDVWADGAQVHQSGAGQAGVPPFGNRRHPNLEKPRGGGGSAEQIDSFI